MEDINANTHTGNMQYITQFVINEKKNASG
jgi:hypothetical protein